VPDRLRRECGLDGRLSPLPTRPDTRITMDVIDFCLLSGGRIDPGTISCAAEGDSALAREIIAAAPAFAGP
jgi:hypothetical protein